MKYLFFITLLFLSGCIAECPFRKSGNEQLHVSVLSINVYNTGKHENNMNPIKDKTDTLQRKEVNYNE